MEGKGNLFFLYIIVAILALALAVLAGYLFIVSGTQKTPADGYQQSTQSKYDLEKRPKDEELTTIKLFDGEKRVFNLKRNESDKSLPVIQVSAELKYFGKEKIKGISDVNKKITDNMGEIEEIICNYFLTMTREQAESDEAFEKGKKDITKEINDLLLAGVEAREKKDIVYTIIFSYRFTQ